MLGVIRSSFKRMTLVQGMGVSLAAPLRPYCRSVYVKPFQFSRPLDSVFRRIPTQPCRRFCTTKPTKPDARQRAAARRAKFTGSPPTLKNFVIATFCSSIVGGIATSGFKSIGCDIVPYGSNILALLTTYYPFFYMLDGTSAATRIKGVLHVHPGYLPHWFGCTIFLTPVIYSCILGTVLIFASAVSSSR